MLTASSDSRAIMSKGSEYARSPSSRASRRTAGDRSEMAAILTPSTRFQASRWIFPALPTPTIPTLMLCPSLFSVRVRRTLRQSTRHTCRTLDERPDASRRDQRCSQGQEAGVRHDGVADLQLRLAEAPRLEAHRQLAHAIAGEHAAEHDLGDGGEAVGAEADTLQRVATIGAEQAGERVHVLPDQHLVQVGDTAAEREAEAASLGGLAARVPRGSGGDVAALLD